MPTTADLLNVAAVLTLDGKEYRLSPPNLEQQGRFQRWLEQRARESVDRADYLEAEQRAAAQNSVTREITAGFYAWDGPIGAAARQSPAGSAKWAQICLDVDEPTARRMVDEYLGKMVEVIRRARAKDPKGLARALATLGLPANFVETKNLPSTGGRKKSGSSGSKTRRSTKRKKRSGH